MKRPPFTLDSLLTLRSNRADEAIRELGAAVAKREEKAQVAIRAERRLSDHQARTSRVETIEQRAFSEGALSAADLQTAEAWRSRVAEEQQRLARQAEVSRAASVEAQSFEERAQEGLATRRAEKMVVEKAKSKWAAAFEKANELAEEESVLEAWQPRAS